MTFIFGQSNEVTSSQAMELEGLKRSLRYLEGKNVNCTNLTTDRHPSIKKFMRETMAHIKHWFDVWHVAKGKNTRCSLGESTTFANMITSLKILRFTGMQQGKLMITIS